MGESNRSFLNRERGSAPGMTGAPPEHDPTDPERKGLFEVVPAPAVLTELARGFLLVRDSDPERALRFASTFLRERAGSPRPERVEAVPKITLARLSLGRSPRGAVEPPVSGLGRI
ncbi:MAG: hypothetical protein WBG19_00395 [Thermoplasmata archaeon]